MIIRILQTCTWSSDSLCFLLPFQTTFSDVDIFQQFIILYFYVIAISFNYFSVVSEKLCLAQSWF